MSLPFTLSLFKGCSGYLESHAPINQCLAKQEKIINIAKNKTQEVRGGASRRPSLLG